MSNTTLECLAKLLRRSAVSPIMLLMDRLCTASLLDLEQQCVPLGTVPKGRCSSTSSSSSNSSRIVQTFRRTAAGLQKFHFSRSPSFNNANNLFNYNSHKTQQFTCANASYMPSSTRLFPSYGTFDILSRAELVQECEKDICMLNYAVAPRNNI
jgi:hypothetical protein